MAIQVLDEMPETRILLFSGQVAGQAVHYAKQLSYWRGLTQVDGLLALAYLHQAALQPALTAINDAIAANEQIPDELYFVPRDLAIKAQIMARKGCEPFPVRCGNRLGGLRMWLPSPLGAPGCARCGLSLGSESRSRAEFANIAPPRMPQDAPRALPTAVSYVRRARTSRAVL